MSGELGRGCSCEGLQGPCILKAYTKQLDEALELVKSIQVSRRDRTGATAEADNL